MRGGLAVLGILVWELAVRIFAIPDYLLPPPSGVAVELIARFALIARHAGVTLGEVGVGLAAAVAGGAVLAVAMASMPFLHRGLYPLLAFLQASATARSRPTRRSRKPISGWRDGGLARNRRRLHRL